jgi:hypothetical protein
MTDQEITRFVAEHCMGWRRLDHPGPPPFFRWINAVNQHAGWESWDPLTQWAAAGEIVERISEKYCVSWDSVGHSPLRWRCMVGWGDDPVSVMAEAETGPRAITLAAAKAFGAEVPA